MYEFLDYRVEDVMSSPARTIRPDATLAEAEAEFEKLDVNGLPVVDAAGELCGFLTKLDLLAAFRFNDEQMFPPYEEIMGWRVDRVMSPEPLSVAPRTPLTRVLRKLLETRSKSFPVLDGTRLVGVIAREDVLRGLRRAAQGEQAPNPPESAGGELGGME